MDKVFYIIVDSTLYPLPHIKDDKYRIPKTIIDRISEVDTFYFYLETNKGYYWTYARNAQYLLSIYIVSFLGCSYTGAVRVYDLFITPYVFIPIRYKVKVPSVRTGAGSLATSPGFVHYQKKR